MTRKEEERLSEHSHHDGEELMSFLRLIPYCDSMLDALPVLCREAKRGGVVEAAK
jgi:hypothetical protein